MAQRSMANKPVRTIFAVLGIGATLFGLGWMVVTPSHPIPGLFLMLAGVSYVLYEAYDSGWAKTNIPGTFRFLLIVMVAACLLGLYERPIKLLFSPARTSSEDHSKEPKPPQAPPSSPTADEIADEVAKKINHPSSTGSFKEKPPDHDIVKSLKQLTAQLESLKSSSSPRPWIYVTNAWMEDQNNHHFFHLVVTNKGSLPAYHLDYKHWDEIGTSRFKNPTSDGIEFDKESSSNGYFFSHLDMLAPGDPTTFGYGPETIDMTLERWKSEPHKTIRRIGQLTYSDTSETTRSSVWGKDFGLLKFCFEMIRVTEQEQAISKGPSIVLSLCTEKGTNISK
jgi:hypothetical protein